MCRLTTQGTYIRVNSIDLLVEAFLNKDDSPKQIISLGAGSDTRPFQLLTNEKYHNRLVYHEIDFPVSTSRKVAAIVADPRFSSAIGTGIEKSENEIHSETYHLHAQDLRNIKSDSFEILRGMDQSIDTLVISECCLCYLEPAESAAVLSWFKSKFSRMGCIIYEPIGLDDQFGRVMIQNLAVRGISLPTLNKYHSLRSQVERLVALGLENSRAADMEFIHDNWLSREDNERIDNLEFLDEREELNLLLRHYCIAWGSGQSWKWDFPENSQQA
ncbi:Ppm1p [Sugiyamaella lignohabitans]|uniref:Leucine carboxyl methyltransferase 1 n=1 Tax=Sugiyamaella lignohabitans TaxID=796027 RepID=A0A167CFC1_9ASCO|nr:Ppm1p [Sugiyamaella lignohabitans]ANB11615.1 Ppm1p [Sugiyamaella lignohabitans]